MAETVISSRSAHVDYNQGDVFAAVLSEHLLTAHQVLNCPILGIFVVEHADDGIVQYARSLGRDAVYGHELFGYTVCMLAEGVREEDLSEDEVMALRSPISLSDSKQILRGALDRKHRPPP